MTTTNIDLDDDLHAALRDMDDSMKNLVNDALREKLGVEDLSSTDAIERRIDKKEDELRETWHEREQLEAREDRLETELAQLKERLEEIENNSASLIEDLNGILDDMLESPNKHVFAALPVVKRTATRHDMTAGDIMQVLQDRANERDLAIEDARFKKKTACAQVN